MNLCPHFGDCGGCQSQDVPYETQLAAKAALLEDLFAPFQNRTDPRNPVAGNLALP